MRLGKLIAELFSSIDCVKCSPTTRPARCVQLNISVILGLIFISQQNAAKLTSQTAKQRGEKEDARNFFFICH